MLVGHVVLYNIFLNTIIFSGNIIFSSFYTLGTLDDEDLVTHPGGG